MFGIGDVHPLEVIGGMDAALKQAFGRVEICLRTGEQPCVEQRIDGVAPAAAGAVE
jgi:hypothetical protein